jgi:hypothetical protein
VNGLRKVREDLRNYLFILDLHPSSHVKMDT